MMASGTKTLVSKSRLTTCVRNGFAPEAGGSVPENLEADGVRMSSTSAPSWRTRRTTWNAEKDRLMYAKNGGNNKDERLAWRQVSEA